VKNGQVLLYAVFSNATLASAGRLHHNTALSRDQTKGNWIILRKGGPIQCCKEPGWLQNGSVRCTTRSHFVSSLDKLGRRALRDWEIVVHNFVGHGRNVDIDNSIVSGRDCLIQLQLQGKRRLLQAFQGCLLLCTKQCLELLTAVSSGPSQHSSGHHSLSFVTLLDE
jgi:hypothetical protein